MGTPRGCAGCASRRDRRAEVAAAGWSDSSVERPGAGAGAVRAPVDFTPGRADLPLARVDFGLGAVDLALARFDFVVGAVDLALARFDFVLGAVDLALARFDFVLGAVDLALGAGRGVDFDSPSASCAPASGVAARAGRLSLRRWGRERGNALSSSDGRSFVIGTRAKSGTCVQPETYFAVLGNSLGKTAENVS